MTDSKRKVISFLAADKNYNAAEEQSRNIIGQRIAQYRKENKMSRPEFYELITRYGITVGQQATRKWETGEGTPSAYQLLALASGMGVEDNIFYFSSKPTELNGEGRRKVSEYRRDLIASGNYVPEEENRVEHIEVLVAYMGVSAGTGNFLDDGNFEKKSFPRSEVPEEADFGVYVTGDSMEPAYHDGQLVWVQKCDELMPGEIGIFVYDGDGYIKKYGEKKPGAKDREYFTDSTGKMHLQPVLISLNEAYAPKAVSPHKEFQVVGRVL